MNILLVISIIISFAQISRASDSEHSAKVTDVLKEFLNEIKNLKTELQDVLSKREHVDSDLAAGLSEKISSKLAQNYVIVELKSLLDEAETDQGAKVQECREILDTHLKRLIQNLDDTVIANAEENLSVIDDSLALIKKDLTSTEKKIQNELASPDVQTAMCENDNKYCHLLDEIADDLEVNMSILDNLEQALPSMVKTSLYYIDNPEVTEKIKRKVAQPVNECLKQ